MAQLCKGEEDEGGQKRKHENECAHEAHHCDRRRGYKSFLLPGTPHRAKKQRPTKRNVFFPITRRGEDPFSLTMVSIAYPTYCNINR